MNKTLAAGILAALLAANPSSNASDGSKHLVAHSFNSGFAEAHDSYNSMGTGSDGRIYYVLSTESYDVAAEMFVFDPKTKRIQRLGDLTEACGEKGTKAIPQGKSHVNFVEAKGKLLLTLTLNGSHYPLTIDLLITHRVSRITHHASRITHHVSRITYHASRITHHASRITRHASRITHHASRITHH